jgi:hypothetical protein
MNPHPPVIMTFLFLNSVMSGTFQSKILSISYEHLPNPTLSIQPLVYKAKIALIPYFYQRNGMYRKHYRVEWKIFSVNGADSVLIDRALKSQVSLRQKQENATKI